RVGPGLELAAGRAISPATGGRQRRSCIRDRRGAVLMVADLTRGTGRFNFAQGLMATAIGFGAAASPFLTGVVLARPGSDAGPAATGDASSPRLLALSRFSV